MRIVVPHDLDKAEVRERLADRTDELGQFIPGGVAEVSSDWVGQDRVELGIRAMGQRIKAAIDIEDHQMVVTVKLPAQLRFFAGPVEKAIRDKGTKLLR